MHDQTPVINWIDNGVPFSQMFNYPYYSTENGIDETLHVFLKGNGLPERFYDGFQIAELGFGTGLNMLVSINEFIRSSNKGKLKYISFEAFPLSTNQIAKALSKFPTLNPEIILDHWKQETLEIKTEQYEIQIIVGDARKTLKHWAEAADAWFSDGFAPSRNPELWQLDLMRDVVTHTKTLGTFSTYSSAGIIRCNLADVGFNVTKSTGFGKKRHMSKGIKF